MGAFSFAPSPQGVHHYGLRPQAWLGNLYAGGSAFGFRQKPDFERAFKWYLEAAKQGDVSSRYSVAEMYENGQGVSRDFSEALKWYLQATRGLNFCPYKIGQMYEEGKGTKQDLKEAVRWYREAAKWKWYPAFLKLAKMYKDGRGIRKNRTTALKWYKLAVQKGYSDPEFGGQN